LVVPPFDTDQTCRSKTKNEQGAKCNLERGETHLELFLPSCKQIEI
jgi:hypothetical protein